MPTLRNRSELYAYFQTGDRPNQTQFEELIYSCYNRVEDSLDFQQWMSYVPYIPSPQREYSGLFPVPSNANQLIAFRIIVQSVTPYEGPGVGTLNVRLDIGGSVINPFSPSPSSPPLSEGALDSEIIFDTPIDVEPGNINQIEVFIEHNGLGSAEYLSISFLFNLIG